MNYFLLKKYAIESPMFYVKQITIGTIAFLGYCKTYFDVLLRAACKIKVK